MDEDGETERVFQGGSPLSRPPAHAEQLDLINGDREPEDLR
jgi:hypothetical protein